MYYNRWYTPQRPMQVKGGIKAHSISGGFGKSWWARRWIEVLESFNIDARLSRGRSYARKGQVLDISIDTGIITAKVQGSRSTPYKVKITIKLLSDAEWNKVTKIMAGQAIFSAKLLAGEMPQDIEEAFTSANISLFPKKLHDIKTDCSCPDWSNPCKHIAAVYYLIGEEFERDPFLIFQLRGMPMERLMNSIRKHRGKDETSTESEGKDVSSCLLITVEDIPLEKSIDTFWQMGMMSSGFLADISEPPLPAAIIKTLGTPPLWRGQARFTETMKDLYPHFTKACLRILTNDT